jgi:3-hydroxyisobutyrate dehydrogenase-like beta-hydroxyacid dehydrogenase
MQITFLGIGLMGEPMARRLLAAGHTVVAWNRTPGKAAALADAGARPLADLHHALQASPLVISMLEAGPTVASVLQAALPSLAPNALWIDMSSTQQAEAQAFHQQLTAQGRRFIDAPVSGGVAGAAAGTLAIMAGGSVEDFAEAEPVLAAMGRATLVGPAGSGQVAKLCNQLIVGATINIVAEAMLLAQAAGADPVAMRAAIRGGFAESKILEVHGQRMLERNFVAGGKVSTQLKDQRNILAAAEAAGIVLPISELVAARYMTLSRTIPQADHSAALIGLEQLNPGQRVGTAPDNLGG